MLHLYYKWDHLLKVQVKIINISVSKILLSLYDRKIEKFAVKSFLNKLTDQSYYENKLYESIIKVYKEKIYM